MSAERSAERRRGFTRSAFQFFLDHAGYGVPPGRVICARELARAEYLGLSRSWEVRWESESECYCAGPNGDVDAEYQCPCRRSYAGRSWGRWECFCELASVYDAGELRSWAESPVIWPLASLGGICGADPAYRRVIRAELFAELIAPELAELGRWDAFLARVPAGPSVGER